MIDNLKLTSISKKIEGITKGDILDAMRVLRDNGDKLPNGFQPSTTYDVVSEGHHYPPVAVIGLAAERTAGTILRYEDGLRGGEGTPCFRKLRKLGFTVKRKTKRKGTVTDRAYTDFGQAPDDNPDQLQQFARHVRRGQPKFRRKLFKLFGGRCAISQTSIEAVLEAAHIEPHAQSGVNHTDNGILLRADLHSLFDYDLVRINPETLRLEVSQLLAESEYQNYHGTPVFSSIEVTEERRARLRTRWNKPQSRE